MAGKAGEELRGGIRNATRYPLPPSGVACVLPCSPSAEPTLAPATQGEVCYVQEKYSNAIREIYATHTAGGDFSVRWRRGRGEQGTTSMLHAVLPHLCGSAVSHLSAIDDGHPFDCLTASGANRVHHGKHVKPIGDLSEYDLRSQHLSGGWEGDARGADGASTKFEITGGGSRACHRATGTGWW